MILHFNDVFIDSYGTTWIAENRFNGLFCKKPHDNNVRYIGRFPGENMFGRNMFREALAIDNQIVFAPWGAKRVHVVNPQNQRINSIQISNENVNKYNMACLYGVFSWGDCIYFLQSCSTTLIGMETDTNSLFELDLIPPRKSSDYMKYWNYRVLQSENRVILCDGVERILVSIDLNCNKTELLSLDDCTDTIIDFLFIENDLFFVDQAGTVYIKNDEGIKRIGEFNAKDCSFVVNKSVLYLFSNIEHRLIQAINNDSIDLRRLNNYFANTIVSGIVKDQLFTQKKDGSYGMDFNFHDGFHCEDFKIDLKKHDNVFLNESSMQDLEFYLETIKKLENNN